MDTLCLGLVIVLGALKEALATFSDPREALKMVFGVRSIRVFSKFLLDPYYKQIPWFMILMKFLMKSLIVKLIKIR